MKVRIVTQANKVVGYQRLENNSPAPGEFRGGLIAGPGQQILEADLPEDFDLVANPEDIHKKLAAHLHKKAA